VSPIYRFLHVSSNSSSFFPSFCYLVYFQLANCPDLATGYLPFPPPTRAEFASPFLLAGTRLKGSLPPSLTFFPMSESQAGPCLFFLLRPGGSLVAKHSGSSPPSPFFWVGHPPPPNFIDDQFSPLFFFSFFFLLETSQAKLDLLAPLMPTCREGTAVFSL